MLEQPEPIEQFWDDLLSEEPGRVSAAYAYLSPETRPAVLAHLQRMATEPGWQPGQRQAALAALDILKQA